MFGSPIRPLEFELDDGPAIEMLLNAYPDPVLVSDLPHASEDEEDKVAIARALFKEGILLIVDEMSKGTPSKMADDESVDDEDPF